MAEIDRDGDGVLSQAELSAYVRRQTARKSGTMSNNGKTSDNRGNHQQPDAKQGPPSLVVKDEAKSQ